MISYATVNMMRKYAADDYCVIFGESSRDCMREILIKYIAKIVFGSGLIRYYTGNRLNRLPTEYQGLKNPCVFEQLSGLKEQRSDKTFFYQGW